MKKKFLVAISFIATILIVYLLVRSLATTYSQIDWSIININIKYIIISFILLIAGYLKLAYNWREIVLSMYENIKMSKGIFYWCLSQFGKYIPGKVWFAVGRVYLAKGISRKIIIHSIFIEVILCVITTFALGSIFLSNTEEAGIYIIYTLITAIVLIAVHPTIFNFAMRIICRLIKKDFSVELHYGEIVKLLINFAIAWLLIGTGFAFLVRGIGITGIPMGMLIGTFLMSWVAGFLAIIVPSGIGVREGVIAALLSHETGIGMALIIAIIARLWWTLGEIIALPVAYSLVLIADKLKRKDVKNVPGNYFDKYNSRNPLVRMLMWLYFKELFDMIRKTGAKNILDVGCGEGHATSRIKDNFHVSIKGCDLEEKVIEKARKNYPDINFGVGNIYKLREKDKTYELVIAGEVMEHLYETEKAIIELKRVSNKFVIISVPHEPLWRVANILRGRYLKALGNTPGHVQNFSKKEIRNLLRKHFSIVNVRTAGLWTIALCRK